MKSKRSVIPNGAKITRLRTQHHLTQWELAQQAGLSPKTLWNIENGQRALPTGLEAIAGVLGVAYETLLQAVDHEPLPPSHEPSSLSFSLWRVPFQRNPNFVGREPLLDNLYQTWDILFLRRDLQLALDSIHDMF